MLSMLKQGKIMIFIGKLPYQN